MKTKNLIYALNLINIIRQSKELTMDLNKLTEDMRAKVDQLEMVRKTQQYYIKKQFNTGRQKGIRDRQRIISLLATVRWSYLFGLSLILATTSYFVYVWNIIQTQTVLFLGFTFAIVGIITGLINLIKISYELVKALQRIIVIK